MSRKPKSETEPAATVETAQAELDSAQQELQSFNVHRGDLSEVATRRRELAERVEIAKERLQLAEQRAAEIEFSETERRIDELTVQARQIEGELLQAREQAAADLRQHLNGDWLAGTGRFASQRPAIGELLGYSVSVNEVEQRRDAVLNEIRRLERKVSERREQRDRDAAAVRLEKRKSLLQGDVVELRLIPWKIEVHPGFVQDVADSLARKFIPSAMTGTSGRTIHCLLPEDSKPVAWCDGNHIEAAAQIEPAALCGPMAEMLKKARGRVKASR